MLRAPSNDWRSVVQNRLQSKLMPIHLCGLVQYESTRSRPSLTQRYSGTSAAMPDIAASTWSQTFSRRHTRPISGVGSNASDEVVPRVAQTKNGTRPRSRSSAIIASRASTRMANASSWGTVRIRSVPMPAMRKPLLDARVGLRRGVGDEPGGVAVGVDRAGRRPPPRGEDRHQHGFAGRALDHPAAQLARRPERVRERRAARSSSRASASRVRCRPAR